MDLASEIYNGDFRDGQFLFVNILIQVQFYRQFFKIINGTQM